MADENENKIYVGSLSFKIDDDGLRKHFNKECGKVVDGKFYFVSLSWKLRLTKDFLFLSSNNDPSTDFSFFLTSTRKFTK